MITFGSLFAGIGGLDLGLERAGMQCRWQVEIDDYARRVLAKHWPDVRRHDDVRTWPQADTEQVDLIVGGFPCTDISNAGKRAGITGEQSGLWTEFARIIRELRPRIVLVENVAALLGRGMDRVLGDLAESGFDAEWDCIPASAVGAPHRRDRVFVVSYAEGIGRRSRRPWGVVGTGARKEDAAGMANASIEDDRRGDSESAERQGTEFGEGDSRAGGPWAVEPAVGRVADGVPDRMDRLRCLGNAVVPQVAEWIGRRIIEGLSI